MVWLAVDVEVLRSIDFRCRKKNERMITEWKKERSSKRKKERKDEKLRQRQTKKLNRWREE